MKTGTLLIILPLLSKKKRSWIHKIKKLAILYDTQRSFIQPLVFTDNQSWWDQIR